MRMKTKRDPRGSASCACQALKGVRLFFRMCLLRDLPSQLAEAHLRMGTEQGVGRHRNGRAYRFPILGGQVVGACARWSNSFWKISNSAVSPCAGSRRVLKFRRTSP